MINGCSIGTQGTLDDPEKYEVGPVGLQVVGRRFDEEKILGHSRNYHTDYRESRVETESVHQRYTSHKDSSSNS